VESEPTLQEVIDDIITHGRMYIPLKENYFCDINFEQVKLLNLDTQQMIACMSAEIKIYYYLADLGLYRKHIRKPIIKKVIEYFDEHKILVTRAALYIETEDISIYDVDPWYTKPKDSTYYMVHATREQLDKIIDLDNVDVFAITSRKTDKYISLLDDRIIAAHCFDEYKDMLIEMLNFALPEGVYI
jgi:hypothetical protein